jgi:hypothetical protein
MRVFLWPGEGELEHRVGIDNTDSLYGPVKAEEVTA